LIMGFPESAALFGALEPLPTDYSDPEALAAYVTGLGDQEPPELGADSLDLNEDGQTDQADAEFAVGMVQEQLGMGDDGSTDPFNPETVDPADPTTYPSNQEEFLAYAAFISDPNNTPTGPYPPEIDFDGDGAPSQGDVTGGVEFAQEQIGMGDDGSTEPFDPESVDPADPATYPSIRKILLRMRLSYLILRIFLPMDMQIQDWMVMRMDSQARATLKLLWPVPKSS